MNLKKILKIKIIKKKLSNSKIYKKANLKMKITLYFLVKTLSKNKK